MNQYLDKAREKIPHVPMLINLVSRRVRQFIGGQRPMVKPDHPNMPMLNLALKEIAEGKLTAEQDVTLQQEKPEFQRAITLE